MEVSEADRLWREMKETMIKHNAILINVSYEPTEVKAYKNIQLFGGVYKVTPAHKTTFMRFGGIES